MPRLQPAGFVQFAFRGRIVAEVFENLSHCHVRFRQLGIEAQGRLGGVPRFFSCLLAGIESSAEHAQKRLCQPCATAVRASRCSSSGFQISEP